MKGTWLLVLLATAAAEPVWPIPRALWRPAAPPSTDHFCFESGLNSTCTQGLAVEEVGQTLKVAAQTFMGSFEVGRPLGKLMKGYYRDQIAMAVALEGRAPCFGVEGWLAVDDVQYEKGILTYIDFRFEQYCSQSLRIRGALLWSIQEHSAPQRPSPANVLPSSGNYAYLQGPNPADISISNSSNAIVTCSFRHNEVQVEVKGSLPWSAVFQGRESLETGELGVFQRLPRTGKSAGWFVVDEIKPEETFKARFLQNSDKTVYYGVVFCDKRSLAETPPPVFPPPPYLWSPDNASLPPSGNYFYLESNYTESMAALYNFTLTRFNSVLSVSSSKGRISLEAHANGHWKGKFLGSNVTRLAKGYYGELTGPPFNSTMAGLEVKCKGLQMELHQAQGWFVIDSITYSGQALETLSLRFEYAGVNHELGSIRLRGAIEWKASNPASLTPLYPPPQDLWQPPQSVLSTTSNYAYIETARFNHSYTPANAQFNFTQTQGLLAVSIQGNHYWTGYFKTMETLSRLEVGYYGLLHHYPHNSTVAQIAWQRMTWVFAWMVVDEVVYEQQAMTAIRMRFEIESFAYFPTTVRGAFSWNVSNSQGLPAPPVFPPPPLWKPHAVPSTGNYVYLETETSSGKQTSTYTVANAVLGVVAAGNSLTVTVSISVPQGDNNQMTGEFKTPYTLSQLEVGYYGHITNKETVNPAIGSAQWNGICPGYVCEYHPSKGWFVVDFLNYTEEGLSAIELRFKESTEATGTVLHRAVHWAASNPTNPPGPTSPPSNLWQPPQGTLPSSGLRLLGKPSRRPNRQRSELLLHFQLHPSQLH